jgi:hypothetical protein
MSVIVFLFTALLFFALIPGVIVTLPPKGGKFIVAGVHSLIFSILYYLSHKSVWRLGVSLEGFTDPSKNEDDDEEDEKENVMSSDEKLPMPTTKGKMHSPSPSPLPSQSPSPTTTETVVTSIPTESFTLYK